jgi:hypothetical protein
LRSEGILALTEEFIVRRFSPLVVDEIAVFLHIDLRGFHIVLSFLVSVAVLPESSYSECVKACVSASGNVKVAIRTS